MHATNVILLWIRKYYFYEFVSKDKRVAMSAAAAAGRVSHYSDFFSLHTGLYWPVSGNSSPKYDPV
jgi:hypothetical protein